MDGAEESGGSLIVASGNGPVLLELGEEVLDEVASFVQVRIVFALHLASSNAGDDDRLAGLQ